MKTAKKFLKDKGLKDTLYNVNYNPNQNRGIPQEEWIKGGLSKLLEEFAAQSPAISRERLVEIIKNNVWTISAYGIEGVSHAADAILSELGAEPEQPKNDEAIEIVKKLADWSEKYPRDPIYPKSRMSMDEELIEIEKAAKEFCGKCGKKK